MTIDDVTVEAFATMTLRQIEVLTCAPLDAGVTSARAIKRACGGVSVSRQLAALEGRGYLAYGPAGWLRTLLGHEIVRALRGER